MRKQFISLLLALALVMALLPTGLAEEVQTEEIPEDPFEEIVMEFNGAVTVDPYTIEVKPSRVSGWAELLWAPTERSPIIATYAAQQSLTVLKETPHWLMARNEETGDIGYLPKYYATEVREDANSEKQTLTIVENGKTNLGVIDINGAFSLQCRLPEGYLIEPVRSAGDLMVAFLRSEDPEKPFMMLSVAFDEEYAHVDRMNDLGDEELAVLEKTFTDMDPTVNISYGDTGMGTRLMIASQTESGMNYLDIMSIYKGYFVELVMAPSETSSVRTLSEEQMATCIDFLTDLDFVSAEDLEALKSAAGEPQTANLLEYSADRQTVLTEVLRLKGEDTDAPEWEVVATLLLKVTEETKFQDDVDPATGEKLETPAEYTGDAFAALLEEEGIADFAAENIIVTFDEDGDLTFVERVSAP